MNNFFIFLKNFIGKLNLLVLFILFLSSSTYGMDNEAYKKTSIKLCDLRNNEILKDEKGDIPYIKCAIWKEEESKFPAQVISHTQKFVQREMILRKKHNIGENLNIAQFCFYFFYNESLFEKKVKIFEDKPPSSSFEGVFYLSRNKPSNYEKKTTKGTNISEINKQNIALYDEKSRAILIQREQPIVKSIEATLNYLSKAPIYITTSNEEKIKILINNVEKKTTEIKNLRDNQIKVIKYLKSISEKFSHNNLIEEENPLVTPTQVFMSNLIKDIITSIEKDDFEFNFLGEKKEDKNIRIYIENIKKQLCERPFTELLNSKYFNLGCSEQLLLYDLGQETWKKMFYQKIKADLSKETLESVWLHIHTTKAPCKACLLGCCGHLENGWISSLFEMIKSKANAPVQLRMIISYEKPYMEDYGFFIPITDEKNPPERLLLLVGYNRLIKKLKSKIFYCVLI